MTAALKRVLGALFFGGFTTSPLFTRLRFSVIAGTARISASPSLIGLDQLAPMARSMSLRWSGASSGSQGSVGIRAAAASSSSSSAVIISMPETPSTAAWCILASSAKLPGGTPSMASSPSMNQVSQSGRDMSSGVDINWLASAKNCSRVPGAGTEACRTWNSMSKSPSLIQYG